MEQTTLSPPYGNYAIGTLKRELERLRIEKALGKARKYLSHSECMNVMQTIFDGVKPDPVNGYTFEIVAAHIYGGGSGAPKRPTEPAPEPSGDPLEVLRTLLGGGASKDALKALETTTEILFTEVLAIQEQLKNRPPKVIQVVTQEGKEVGDVDGPVHTQFERIVQKIAAGIPVLLCGPSGSGKTTIAEQAAKSLGLRFGFFSCTRGMDETAFQGTLGPEMVDGEVVIKHIPTDFIRCAKEGGLFCIDEVDAADENVLLGLNAILSNGSFALPNNPEMPYVKIHKDFRIVACANTWGTGADRQYVGRSELDAAFLDRFVGGMHLLDYDESLEDSLISPEILAWGRALREQIRTHKIRRFVSMRAMIRACEHPEIWPTVEDFERDFLVNWDDSELRRIGKR